MFISRSAPLRCVFHSTDGSSVSQQLVYCATQRGFYHLPWSSGKDPRSSMGICNWAIHGFGTNRTGARVKLSPPRTLQKRSRVFPCVLLSWFAALSCSLSERRCSLLMASYQCAFRSRVSSRGQPLPPQKRNYRVFSSRISGFRPGRGAGVS